MRSYWDHVAERYPGYYRDGYSQRENQIVHRDLVLLFRPPLKVLDIGCGQGLGALLMPRNNAMYGVDISAGMIGRANGFYCHTKVADATDYLLNCPANEYEGAIATFNVFAYIDRPDVFMSNLKRVVRPGSPVYLMTLNRYALWRLLALDTSPYAPYGTRDEKQIEPIAVNFYSRARFKGYLSRWFERVQVKPMSWFGKVYQKPQVWALDRLLCKIAPNMAHTWRGWGYG